MQSQYSIFQMPESERPRERLLKHGPETLTTSELIAIILGSGMKGIPILQLAQEIVSRFGNTTKLSEATVEELCTIKGLGPAKALQLKAALSLGMRVSKQTQSARYRIEHPVHAYNLIKDELENEHRELFMVILQDTRGYAIGQHVISIGTLSNTLVHPREVFHPAIRHHAASIILAHNHPSGDPTPSKEDYEITSTLLEVSRVMDIPINDHLIVGAKSYISLRQLGLKF
jgi:DNA repair protein RadC